jgi:AraC-like DNA-binding protein
LIDDVTQAPPALMASLQARPPQLPARADAGSRLRISIAKEVSTNGTIERAMVGCLRIARVSRGPHQMAHVPSASGGNVVMLVLQGYGVSILKQKDRIARIAPGQMCLCDSAHPYTIRNPASSQRIALLVPRDRFDRRIDLSEVLLRTLQSGGSSRVLSATLASLVDELTVVDGARASVWADCVIQMLQLAIREQAVAVPWASERMALGERIRAYVKENLRDPRLSIDTIASALGRSKSALHRAVRPGSIHDLIWNDRLQWGRRDLLNPAVRHQSITSIALSWGFRDASHFCHAFKRHFGQSPREVRKHATDSSAP